MSRPTPSLRVLKELRASLETINSTSSELITDIDRHYAEIMKEREANLSITEPVLQTPTEEALYLVDDTVYLHIQPTDSGWDYSLYDKETKKHMDGGVIDTADIEASPHSAIQTEVFALQGMTPTKVTFEDIALVDDLQAAQLPEVQTVESNTVPANSKEYTDDDVPKNPVGDFIDEIARNVQEETPVQAPDNGYMPDPSMSIEAMNAYGYMDADMLPLSKERALELFERDVPIYMLYEGNTEAMAFEAEDIALFSGCFGVTREDWDAIKNEIPPMDADIVSRKREQAFLESPGDTYAIYQLRQDDTTADIRFMNSDYLRGKGIEPQYENYELIYTGALTKDGSQIDKFLRLYPSANILAATKKDFEPRNRKKFCGRIATGDYDAIIIGHSQFERIPISQERQERLLQEQIAEIEEGLEELKASRAERFTIKSLERTKKSLEARLQKLQDSTRKDDVITFEQLGVDRLYVDEAHNYKNRAKRCA